MIYTIHKFTAHVQCRKDELYKLYDLIGGDDALLLDITIKSKKKLAGHESGTK